MNSRPCNCDDSKAAMRLVRLFAWRARYLQLVHSCPHPGLGDAPRREWDRRMRVARTKLEGLEPR